jgi:hypothetical protein
MARPISSGEVWTDAHGFAAVALPTDADVDLEVDVRALTKGVSAEVATEPGRRRFTVTTNEPHVKVAWKVTAQTVTRKKERRTLRPPTSALDGDER